MDPSVLAAVVGALETIYNVASSNDERKAAQEVDIVRHFGLSLVENAIRYKWTDGTFDAESKTRIRAAVIDLAAKGVRPSHVEQGFIKEKVARVFVELAKRQWPGEWDNMDVILRQMYFSDETGRELALLILRSLCDDVCMYHDSIAELRKKDLRAALITITSSENALRQQYPDGVKGHDDEVYLMVGEPGNDGWIMRLATGLRELLQKQQSQAAVECYDVLACRNMNEEDRAMVIWPMIEQGGIDLVSQAYLRWGSTIIEGDTYTFLKKLMQATVNLGEMQVCAKRNNYVPKELAKFLQILFAMSSHPSVIISSSVPFFWATLLRHEHLSKSEIVHSIIPSLLELYSGFLVKNYDKRKELDPVYNHFAINDFDSSQDFKARALLSYQKATDVIDLGVPAVVFKLLDSPLPQDASIELIELRRRGATTLAKIGRAIPDTLYTIFNDIEVAIQRLVQQNLVTAHEKMALMNFLLIIGSNAHQAVDKRPIFDMVVRPIVVELQSPAMQESIANFNSFMAFIGVQDISTVTSGNVSLEAAQNMRSALKQRRLQLSYCLESLLMFAKESLDVKDPTKLELWSTYMPTILSVVLSTIQSINAVSDRSRWQHLSAEFELLYVLTPEEKERLVKGLSSAKNDEMKESSVMQEEPMTMPLLIRKMVIELKNWLGVVRDLSYRLLAQLTRTGNAFYLTPTLPVLLETSLFESVDQLNDRQLKVLISNVIQPIVLGCPEPLIPSVLDHLMSVLIPYLDTRLCKAWSLAEDEGLQIDENEDPTEMDVSDVIVREMMLRELTRSVTELLYMIFDLRKMKAVMAARTASGDNSPNLGSGSTSSVDAATQQPTFAQYPALSRFLLSHATIARSSILLVRHLLTFKDTQSCIRATGVALSIQTTLLAGDPETRALTVMCVQEFLEAGLMALSDPYHAEGQDRIIHMIIEMYIDVRKVDECPRIVFQQRLGAQPQQLEAFERDLANATSKSKEQAIVRNYLQGCIAVAKSEWFKQKEQKSEQPSSRRIVGEYIKPGRNVLDSAQDEDIGDGLASLFNE
ncbi:Exportin-5 [Actinomortierella wolfii]|nr:Exportin-5 [Actinomortierella wolfii]